MNDVNDKLDALLQSHLKRELDPYVGSAMNKLNAEVRVGGGFEQASWGSRIRYAMAAALMLSIGVAGSIVYRNFNVPPSLPPTADNRVVPYTEAVQSNWTTTYDDGTVMVDEQTPARMLRRVQYQKLDWKDPSGKWQSRIEIPNQDVILVDIPKQ